MSEVHEGGCVCGAIRYRVRGEPLRAYVCHCTFCQRFTGSAFGVLTWFDEENVDRHRPFVSKPPKSANRP